VKGRRHPVIGSLNGVSKEAIQYARLIQMQGLMRSS
jgi:hypothetical protein